MLLNEYAHQGVVVIKSVAVTDGPPERLIINPLNPKYLFLGHGNNTILPEMPVSGFWLRT